MIQRPGKYFVILLSIIILITGCSITGVKNQEYFNSAKEFNNIYFQVVEQIDNNSEVKTLDVFKSEENRKKIERLGALLESIRQTIPKDKEPLYKNFKVRYDDLVLLRDSLANFNNLSLEDRRRIHSALVMISYYRADRNDKKSTTVWE